MSAATPDAAGLLAISRRFPGRWLQGYVRGKLGSDPVYSAAVEATSAHPAPVLDVGCGIGLFGHYLRALGREDSYLGLDNDANKIGIGQKAAGDAQNFRLELGSCETLPAWQGHVALLDILHYLTAAVQQRLLSEAGSRIAPGGVLVIRSVLRDRSWRFGVTRFEEFFMHSIRWMPNGAVHYPELAEIQAPLAAAGLEVEVRPMWGKTPFNSYLILARHKLLRSV